MIICATRGGQGSRAVRLRALQRAREMQDVVLFVYVVGGDAMEHVDPRLHQALRQEMYWLGRVMLRIAVRHGQDEGVPVEALICEGDIREQLALVARQKQARLILLGAPRGTTTDFVGDDAIERLASALHEETGVPVEIAHPEDVVEG